MVEIKIVGNTPLEALSSLTVFGMHCMQNADVRAAANRILEAEKLEEQKLAAPDGARNGVTPPSQAAPAQEPVSDTPEAGQVPTVEQIREKGIAASRKYGKEAVVTLLQKFGASGMSAIAEKDRAAFLAELEGLGEVNA